MKRVFSRYYLLWGPFVALAVAAIPMQADTLTYTGGSQTFTATTAGVYDIVAYGAQGGAGLNTSGGLGAEIGGDITLSAGEMLTVDVGGAGGHAIGVGGGGGGTFVVTSDGTPLVVAGGGGGAGYSFSGTNGQTGTSGASGNPGGAGGTNGTGGGGTFDGGGGGAGFSGAGGNDGVLGGGGGSAYPGLAGGSGYEAGAGGYGGGGGGGGEIGGGGGGGYSGGGGGAGGYSGGGGSYLAAVCSAGLTSDCLIADANEIELSGVASPDLSDNGYVEITEISEITPPAATPEPASLTLLALGLLGIPLTLKLRRTA